MAEHISNLCSKFGVLVYACPKNVLVRFILSVPEELSDELQSCIRGFDDRYQFLTLDHLIHWLQEIQDEVYVPRLTKLF